MRWGSFSIILSCVGLDKSTRLRLRCVTTVNASQRVHRKVLPREIFSSTIFSSSLSAFSQVGHSLGSLRIVIISRTYKFLVIYTFLAHTTNKFLAHTTNKFLEFKLRITWSVNCLENITYIMNTALGIFSICLERNGFIWS